MQMLHRCSSSDHDKQHSHACTAIHTTTYSSIHLRCLIYLIRLRHAPFSRSASSFTAPVVPLSVTISWSGGRMKARHTPATVKVLVCHLFTSQFSCALADKLSFRLDWWVTGWLVSWLSILAAGYANASLTGWLNSLGVNVSPQPHAFFILCPFPVSPSLPLVLPRWNKTAAAPEVGVSENATTVLPLCS